MESKSLHTALDDQIVAIHSFKTHRTYGMRGGCRKCTAALKDMGSSIALAISESLDSDSHIVVYEYKQPQLKIVTLSLVGSGGTCALAVKRPRVSLGPTRQFKFSLPSIVRQPKAQ